MDKIKIQSFTDLHAWKQAHELVLRIYLITETFPQKEIFGLTIQMRRCVVSITSNIAEGFSRSTSADKYHFYIIAHGSLTELQNQLIICRDLGYISNETFQELETKVITVAKLLNGLKRIHKVQHIKPKPNS